MKISSRKLKPKKLSWREKRKLKKELDSQYKIQVLNTLSTICLFLACESRKVGYTGQYRELFKSNFDELSSMAEDYKKID